MGIKFLNSSPYYAQANGQAEASNKIMIKIIQKKIDQKPKRWHSVLNEALWAYRMAPHGAKNISLSAGLWASCCFTLGNVIRFKESGFTKGFKFQRLQWLNDGQVRGFAYDSS
jgi:hypothetical protein